MPTKTALLIRTDESESRISPKNGKDFKIEELYKLLKCNMIQIVPFPKKNILICDEEGNYNGAKPNHLATVICAIDVLLGPEGIMGDAIICESNMLK